MFVHRSDHNCMIKDRRPARWRWRWGGAGGVLRTEKSFEKVRGFRGGGGNRLAREATRALRSPPALRRRLPVPHPASRCRLAIWASPLWLVSAPSSSSPPTLLPVVAN